MHVNTIQCHYCVGGGKITVTFFDVLNNSTEPFAREIDDLLYIIITN